MEKYIFLDFDGVINTPKGKFAKKAVANLLHLVERSDAKIIISSTWRLQGMEYILKLWQEHHMPGEVIGLTPSCNSVNFSNVDGQEYNPQNEMFNNRKTKRYIFKTKRIFFVSPSIMQIM